MDFTGLNRFNAYKINRPLSDEERAESLDTNRSEELDPFDWLSTIKLNSAYMELVDRWYPWKGFSSWLGIIFFAPLLFSIVTVVLLMFEKNELSVWFAGSFIVFLFSLCACLFAWVISMDAFRMTHYPVRLNRKGRKVYAYRPDGSVIRADWDSLFLCRVKNKLTIGQVSFDIRAHVLDESGEVVKETFTLGCPCLGGANDALQFWEYVRIYMEDPDGLEKVQDGVGMLLPIDGRREGFSFGVVRVFASTANHPFVQLLASPIAALTILGRWFAMYTCKVPRWPDEIEAACPVDPDDPYQKDWRDNGKYDFREFGWPLICFFVGLGVLGVGLTFLVRELLA